MKKRNYIKKISNYAMVGGLGAILVTGLVGCDSNNSNNNKEEATFTNANSKQNAFVIIEKSSEGKYSIIDEFPANKTTIVLRTPDGKERILTKEEIDQLVKEEATKIDNGTSGLTNPQISDGGMGLGGVLLSSIAGAMIGSWIGNKLFNNQNFQSQRRTQYKSPQTYSKSQSSFSKNSRTSRTSSGAKKSSGFFGNSSTKSRSSSSFFGG